MGQPLNFHGRSHFQGTAVSTGDTSGAGGVVPTTGGSNPATLAARLRYGQLLPLLDANGILVTSIVATGGGVATITDTKQNFQPPGNLQYLRGYGARIIAGAGANAAISTITVVNSATQFTVAPNWAGGATDATSVYVLQPPTGYIPVITSYTISVAVVGAAGALVTVISSDTRGNTRTLLSHSGLVISSIMDSDVELIGVANGNIALVTNIAALSATLNVEGYWLDESYAYQVT